jgi:colicin import membrane protein
VSLAVDRILDRRSRRESRGPEAASVAVAVLLHAAALAAALVLPRLSPPPPPLAFVPVQIVSAQALGVRRPASRPKAEPPAPEPPKAEPKPEPKPEPARPEPKPAPEETPVLPDKPVKKPVKPKPAAASELPKPSGPVPKPSPKQAAPKPPPGTGAPGDDTGETGRRGAPTGNLQGTAAFGSQIAGLDNPDFKFGYYIDQLLSAIDSKWVRPPLGNDVQAVIGFRIQRDGSLTDLQVARSSGYNSFDLAALRAVQNASPFPPLPRAYRQDSLGVNLIVR